MTPTAPTTYAAYTVLTLTEQGRLDGLNNRLNMHYWDDADYEAGRRGAAVSWRALARRQTRDHASRRCWAAVQAGRWADASMWAGVWARVMRSDR